MRFGSQKEDLRCSYRELWIRNSFAELLVLKQGQCCNNLIYQPFYMNLSLKRATWGRQLSCIQGQLFWRIAFENIQLTTIPANE